MFNRENAYYSEHVQENAYYYRSPYRNECGKRTRARIPESLTGYALSLSGVRTTTRRAQERCWLGLNAPSHRAHVTKAPRRHAASARAAARLRMDSAKAGGAPTAPAPGDRRVWTECAWWLFTKPRATSRCTLCVGHQRRRWQHRLHGPSEGKGTAADHSA